MTIKTIEDVLNQESYNWLNANLPDLAEAIENEVAIGTKPEAIKAQVIRLSQRPELAQRCYLAAKWLSGKG